MSTKDNLRSSKSLPRGCALDSSVDFPQLIPRMLRRYFPSEVYSEGSNSQPVAENKSEVIQEKTENKTKQNFYFKRPKCTENTNLFVP